MLLIMLLHTWARPELPRIVRILLEWSFSYCITWSGYGPKRPIGKGKKRRERFLKKEVVIECARRNPTKKKKKNTNKNKIKRKNFVRLMISLPAGDYMPFRRCMTYLLTRFRFPFLGGATLSFFYFFIFNFVTVTES